MIEWMKFWIYFWKRSELQTRINLLVIVIGIPVFLFQVAIIMYLIFWRL